MDKKELLKYCSEESVLLDNFLLNVFLELDDDFVKIFIKKLRDYTNKKFLNKKILESNKEIISEILRSINFDEKIDYFDKILNSNNKIDILYEKTSIKEKIEVLDFVDNLKNRYNFVKEIILENNEMNNLVSIDKLFNQKQDVSLIGMVLSKRNQNGNLIIELEDLTGKIKVILSKENKNLFEKIKEICLDSVVGIRGFGNNEVIFGNDIYFPNIELKDLKKIDVDESVVFIGDICYGNKSFSEKEFLDFVDFLNNNERVKNLFILGDLIDKNSNNEEVDEKYLGLCNLLDKISKNIVICPSKNNGSSFIEPQIGLNENISKYLLKLENVKIIENPCVFSINGVKILSYNGESFDYYLNNVESLVEKNSYLEVVKYLLKNRDLSFSYLSNKKVPLKNDIFLINEIPNVFVTLKDNLELFSNYNNILLLFLPSWVEKNKVLELKLNRMEVEVLDFENE